MSVFITAKNSKTSIDQSTNYKYSVKPCRSINTPKLYPVFTPMFVQKYHQYI